VGDYLTNHLSKPERAAFDIHRSACPDCEAFLATYQKTIELTRSFLRSRAQVQQPAPLHCEK
jgi:anti-sigma factor RsiW